MTKLIFILSVLYSTLITVSIAKESNDLQLFSYADFNSRCSTEKVFSLFPPLQDITVQAVSYAPVLKSLDNSALSVTVYQKSDPDNRNSLSYNYIQKAFVKECIPVNFMKNAELYPQFIIEATSKDSKISKEDNITLFRSDTNNCAICHTSDSFSAAKPKKGWANNPDEEVDYKLNILRLHDQKNIKEIRELIQSKELDYDLDGLEKTTQRKHINCSDCHHVSAISGSGINKISSITTAIHSVHTDLKDPMHIGGGNNCITCHPSDKLEPMFGNKVMHKIGKRWIRNHEDAVDEEDTIGCTLCHGYDYKGSELSKVSKPLRFKRKLSYKVGDRVSCFDCHKNSDWEMKQGFEKKKHRKKRVHKKRKGKKNRKYNRGKRGQGRYR